MRIPGSLRLRLTLLTTLGCALAFCAGAIGVAGFIQDHRLEQVDDQLRADAGLTQRLIETKTHLPDLGDTGLIVQVYAEGGTVVGGNATGRRAAPLFAAPLPWAARTEPIMRTVRSPSLGTMRALAVPIPDRSSWIVTARSTRALERSAVSVRTALLIGVPLLTLAIGALIWMVVGRALRPVEDLRSTLDDIGARDLSRRLDVRGGGDEIDRLATTLNGLLARVEGASARERRLVADVSHELRSPLAAARALIESRPSDPSEAARHDEVAISALDRLQALVDQLLELARNDLQPARPTRPVDLDGLVLQHAEVLRRTSALTIDTSSVSGGQVLGSEEALGRMVENLAANAARHAHTTVRFSVHETAQQVELVVEDDGPGIAPADRTTVFERFTRLDDSRARIGAGAGLGLGLAIVAGIVRRHDGTVSAGDGSTGQGTSMTVLLPAHEPLDEAD